MPGAGHAGPLTSLLHNTLNPLHSTQLGDDSIAVDALVSLGLAHFRAGALLIRVLCCALLWLRQHLQRFLVSGQNSEAVRVLEKSLAAFEGRGDHMGSSVCLDHLANIYHRLGNASMSVSFLERALTVKRLRHDDKGSASTLLRLGEERLALGQSRAALENLTMALSAFESLADHKSTATCLERLGDAYVRLGLPTMK